MSVAAQPRGLYVLFAAEAWERFSYYGMRALLTLYLVNHLKYERADALGVYATYTGLVYLTPFIGGRLADTVFGARKAILMGGILMALGHLAMAFESLLFVALGLLIVGNGFFKPNISTLVGSLYEQNDARRDAGFTVFYMGINLGALFSPLVCGTLGEKVGWHIGFSAAGIGMIIGLLVFMAGQHLLGMGGFPPGRKTGTGMGLTAADWRDIVVVVVASVLLVLGVLQAWAAWGGLWTALVAWQKLAIAFLGIAAFEGGRRLLQSAEGVAEPKEPLAIEEWKRVAVILILVVFVVFFWMAFEQAGGTMTLFADKQTDRHLLGYEIPASFFQSINPLMILIFGPLFSMMWTRLSETGRSPSTPMKMAIGLNLVGVSFVIMYAGQRLAEQYGSVGPLWLTAVYLFQTWGELCVSPIGLSMVTKLAPARLASLLMGAWFISNAVANYLAGNLEAYVKAYDLPVYGVLIATSFGAGMLLIVLTPVLNRWMGGRA